METLERIGYSRWFQDVNDSYGSLGAWQSAKGFEMHSISVNPNFENADN